MNGLTAGCYLAPVTLVPIDVTLTGLTSWKFCKQALEDAHVALTPGKDFGDHGAERYVRLSYAASDDTLRGGIDRLGKFMARLGAADIPSGADPDWRDPKDK